MDILTAERQALDFVVEGPQLGLDTAASALRGREECLCRPRLRWGQRRGLGEKCATLWADGVMPALAMCLVINHAATNKRRAGSTSRS